MRKLPTAEEAREEMRKSAEERRGRMKPLKPPLKLPEGARDVTNASAGATYAIIGTPRQNRIKKGSGQRY
jgi:hypothetical protein